MRAVYTGHEALTFSDYLDLDTGKTLHAQPGRVYDIAPASGRAVAEVPAGWFRPVYGEAEPEVQVQESSWLPEAAPEPEGETQPEAEAEPAPEPEPDLEQDPAEG